MTETILDAEAGIVKCEHRKMAIIGAGPGRNKAPWGDASYCWQALNEIAQPQFDRHWEMHPATVQSDADLRWLTTCPAPCYVLTLENFESRSALSIEEAETPLGRAILRSPGRPLVPHPVQYPLARLKAAGLRDDYFTCTFAYQVALGVLDGFEAIGLWGVELYDGSARERLVERCCVAYWLGVAEGRGVKIVTDGRVAWQPYLYGYDYDKEKTYVESELAQLRRVMNWEKKDRAEREARR